MLSYSITIHIERGHDCPVCGRTFYYGLWPHIVDCLKRRQKREEGRRIEKCSEEVKEALEKWRKLTC